MYFEDGFSYNQEQVNDIVVSSFLNYMRKNVKEQEFAVSSSKLIESALIKMEISSFDFLNDDSIFMVNEGLGYGLRFLVENQLISSEINPKDKFYKYFARKQLFSSREFSNEFEDNLVLSLIYNQDFSFRYIIKEDFMIFYKTYLSHRYILSAKKLIKVTLPKHKKVKVLVLPRKVATKYLKLAIENYDYTEIADYISNYDKPKNVIRLYSTKPMFDNDDVYDDLVVASHMDKNLRKELTTI